MRWPWQKRKWDPKKHPIAVREFGESTARRLWEANMLGSFIVPSAEGRRSNYSPSPAETLKLYQQLQAQRFNLDPEARAKAIAREKYMNEDDVPL